MVSQKGKTILKSVIILLVLFTIVFAFRAHAADLAMFPDDAKAEYVDANGLPYFSEMGSFEIKHKNLSTLVRFFFIGF